MYKCNFIKNGNGEPASFYLSLDCFVYAIRKKIFNLFSQSLCVCVCDK